jgi:hypothetical protein
MFAGETAAGTGDESPGVHLTQCENLRDLPIRVRKWGKERRCSLRGAARLVRSLKCEGYRLVRATAGLVPFA